MARAAEGKETLAYETAKGYGFNKKRVDETRVALKTLQNLSTGTRPRPAAL
jgi:hypothetical protein